MVDAYVAPMLELLRTVSLRHLCASPLRSLLVLFGISLGVTSLVATILVDRAILSAFHELVERVSGKADWIITRGDAGVAEDLIEEIRRVDGVAHVAGSLEITTRTPGVTGPVLVIGADFLGDRFFLPMKIREGTDLVDDPFALVNDPSAVVISSALARATGAKLDASLVLLTPEGHQSFTVRAILEDHGLATAFGGQVVVMFSEAAQLAFGREGRVDRIDIARSADVPMNTLEAKLNERIAGRARLERPEGRTRHLEAITGPMRRGLHVAGLVAVLVGMFLIYNAVGVAVAERHREIGVLRALGVTRLRVFALFSTEAIALGLSGSTLGLFFGRLLSKIALLDLAPTVSRFYAAIRPASPALSRDVALLGIVVGVSATWLAAGGPALVAARIEPVDALRPGRDVLSTRPLDDAKLVRRGIGLLLLAVVASRFVTLAGGLASMGCLLLAGLSVVPFAVRRLHALLLPVAERLFGVPGRLGLDNAERSLGRSALTVGALLTSIASSVSIASWGTSLERSMFDWLAASLPADLYVTSGSFIADQHDVPFKLDVMSKLEGVSGVLAAFPVRRAAIDVGARRIQVLTLDTRVYHDALERKQMTGRPPVEGPARIDPRVLFEQPSVILAENAASKLGLHAGDTLELETAVGRRGFLIHAVVVDYTSDQGTCLMDGRWYRELFRDPLVDTIDVFLKDGVDPRQVAEDIRVRLGGEETLFVVSATDVREEIRSVIGQALAIFDSTDLVALLVALLGVIGTMLAAVLDRRREMGLLRALGATRAQVVSAVVTEAGFLGLVAALGGLWVGAPMGYAFVKVVGVVGTGWRLDYLFPVARAARVAGLVVFTATLAGLSPGRRAARVPVTEALAYE